RCLLFLHTFTLLFISHDPSSTVISPLSLHDALPICVDAPHTVGIGPRGRRADPCDGRVHDLAVERGGIPLDDLVRRGRQVVDSTDRKSTRLNSSHDQISYAVFCLKKKKKQHRNINTT